MLNPSYFRCRRSKSAGFANLVASNVVMTMVAIGMQRWVMQASMHPTVARHLMTIMIFLSIAPLGLACLVAAWGPGRAMLRSAGLAVAIIAYVAVLHLSELIADLWVLGSFATLLDENDLWLLLGRLGNGVTLCVPITLWLMLSGALLRLRLGPPSLRPMRLHIVGLMIATGIVAGALEFNAHIQARRFDHSFRQRSISPDPSTRMEYTSLAGQRRQTILVMASLGSVSTVLLGVAAWCYRRRRAWMVLAAFMILSLSGSVVFEHVTPRDIVSFDVAILGAVCWIVVHLHWLGQIGWSLSRRKPGIEAPVG